MVKLFTLIVYNDIKSIIRLYAMYKFCVIVTLCNKTPKLERPQ